MILRRLTLADEMAFNRMLADWDDSLFFSLVSDLGFEKYLQMIDQDTFTTSLYGFVDEVIVGKVSIRLEMHPSGHIGYGVVNKCRGQGFGTRLLQESVKAARELGLSKILLVCEEDNIASIKIIQKNGGIHESTSEKRMRFWL